jgi:hypothetical protein
VRHLIASEQYLDQIGFDRQRIQSLDEAVLRRMDRGTRLFEITLDGASPPMVDNAPLIEEPPAPPAIQPIAGPSHAAHLRPAFHADRPLVLFLAQPLCDDAARFAHDVAHAVRRVANTIVVTAEADTTQIVARGIDIIKHTLQGVHDGQLLATLRDLDFTRAEAFTLAGGEEDWAGPLLAAANAPYEVTFVGMRQDPDGRRAPPLPRYVLMAERRNATSRALTAVLNRKWRGLNSVAVHPPEPDTPTSFQVSFPPIGDAEPLRVLLLGQPSPERALGDVLATVSLARQRNAPLQFFMIGASGETIDPRHQGDTTLVHLGPVERSRLNTILSKVRPHLAWFPYSRPPAFDRMISEAALNGLPILAGDLGSAAEQLNARPFSWLAPPRTQPEEWLALLTKLRDTRMTEGPSAAQDSSLPALDANYYLHTYIDRLYQRS